MAFRPAPDPTCGREASEHLDRHVAPHAEHGEQRFPDSIAAEEDDAGLEGCVGALRSTFSPRQLTAPVARSTPPRQRRSSSCPFPSAPARPTISPLSSVRSTGPKLASVKTGYVQQRLGPAVVAPLRERELERSPDHQRDEAVLRHLGGVVGALALPVAEHRDAVGDASTSGSRWLT